jgi:hypothetical protein
VKIRAASSMGSSTLTSQVRQSLAARRFATLRRDAV